MTDRAVCEPRDRWLLGVVAVPLAAFSAFAFDVSHVPTPTAAFAFGVATTLSIELVVVWRALEATRSDAGWPRITLATVVTIGRGSVLAVLAGFLFVEVPAGPTAWLPGALFATAAVLDGVDGRLARATDSVSELGRRLDTEMDALTVLVGAALVVSNGLAPVAFLALGLARYAFVAGTHLRRRRGLAVSSLESSRRRRVIGATAMVAIWLALSPIPGRNLSRLVATVVLVPFLLSFARDWLAVTGRLR